MNNLIEQFLLKEYDSLQNELLELTRRTNSLERDAIILTAAIWTWLFTNDTSLSFYLYCVIIFLPFFIIVIMALRAWRISKKINHIEIHLKGVEKEILKEENNFKGYFTSFKNNKDKKSFYKCSAYIFWGLLILISIIFPCILFCNRHCN